MEARTHSQIMDAAGGIAAVRGSLADLGLDVPYETVRAWMHRQEGAGSIPPEYWPSFVQLNLASLDELAHAAEARRFPDLAAKRRSDIQEGAVA